MLVPMDVHNDPSFKSVQTRTNKYKTCIKHTHSEKDLQLLSNLQVVTDHREDIHRTCWAPQGHATLGEFIHIDDLCGQPSMLKSFGALLGKNLLRIATERPKTAETTC